MTAPGTILLAKMLVPETETPLTSGKAAHKGEPGPDIAAAEMPKDTNVLGAISRGTTDGLHLALNVAAMLISFLALIALANGFWAASMTAWRREAWPGFPNRFNRFSGTFLRLWPLSSGCPGKIASRSATSWAPGW